MTPGVYTRNMNPLPSRRVGLAILTVELEQLGGQGLLIRVRTVDDAIDGKAGSPQAFSDAGLSLHYLEQWLDGWIDEAVTRTVTIR